MNKKEKYKRYGYEDAYDTEKENDWPNRLSLDDCIEIMNNQFNEIIKLKQQLTEKDKENSLLKNVLDNLKGDKASDKLVNAVNAVYEPLLQDKFDEIERLKKELAEKDEEIEKLKETLKIALEDFDEMQKENDKLVCGAKQMLCEGKEVMQSIRHKVCEEIRKLAKPEYIKYGDYCIECIWRCDFEAILDQIEGEE